MRTCNVMPAQNTCRACMDVQIDNYTIEDCKQCERKNIVYELMEVGSNFWGSYAIVSYNGKPKKVALRRICNIESK